MKILLYLSFAFILFLFFRNESRAQIRITNLRCEYLLNPIGIDGGKPRFTWNLSDSTQDSRQNAYQIVVATDSLKALSGIGSVWNSGKVQSSDMNITYGGSNLSPLCHYYWLVKIWDRNDRIVTSALMSFETGVMDYRNWKGTWISDSRDIQLKPAPMFRKEFDTPNRIKSARAYIAVAGLYEMYINGKKVGDHRLDPMYTRFDRRTLYVSYDITGYLQSGKNAVGVILGNGWYNHQSTAVWFFDKAPWRGRPEFCMDIHINYIDGSEETISSDTNWKTTLSPIVFNSIYTGEHYDARLIQTGWNMPAFDDSRWKNAIPLASPSLNIVSQSLQPIRDVEIVPTVKMTKLSNKSYIFDLGRNIAGVSQLVARGQSGTVIRLKHGERLTKEGLVDQSNIDVHYRPTDQSDPYQTDIFTLAGSGEETFKPLFNYKGFQYVEVTSDKPIELKKSDLTGFFMHSDVPPIGTISSSDSIINKIWKSTNNSYLSNLFGYPTDCPQREKNGWTGDAHIASETGLYNFDGITIYEKWLADHRDEHQPNGVLPAIIPTGGWGYTWANGPDWTSTIAIIPWNVYLFYGDSKLLADCYDNIRRYVDHINDTYPTGLTNWGLGDWVPVKSVATKELLTSIYYYVDVTILMKAANLFGKKEDYERYKLLSLKIRNAVNRKYLNPETGIYANGYQTELSAPLHWGVVPYELKAKVAKNLFDRVIADQKHIDVGLLGTKTILNALSANGYADLAFELASQRTFPSWGWWMINGATTLYENWPIDSKSDISLNHIMFGEIGAWLYKSPGGIYPDENHPGFKNILLRPDFVKGLTQFEATHTGPYGKIISSWTRSKTTITYKVTVPPNSIASLTLKGKEILENGKTLSDNKFLTFEKADPNLWIINLKSGNYTFSIK